MKLNSFTSFSMFGSVSSWAQTTGKWGWRHFLKDSALAWPKLSKTEAMQTLPGQNLKASLSFLFLFSAKTPLRVPCLCRVRGWCFPAELVPAMLQHHSQKCSHDGNREGPLGTPEANNTRTRRNHWRTVCKYCCRGEELHFSKLISFYSLLVAKWLGSHMERISLIMDCEMSVCEYFQASWAPP